jgi:hypothetical protein
MEIPAGIVRSVSLVCRADRRDAPFKGHHSPVGLLRRRAKRKFGAVATAAFCAFSLLPLDIANASSVVITGSQFGTGGVVSFPGYGTSIDRNNVVNFGASGLSDSTNGAGWRAQGKKTSSAVIANVPEYAVDWYFLGAESGHTIMFTSQSLTVTEGNQNNNFESNKDPGWWKAGTTTGSGKNEPIPFKLIDTNSSDTIINGDNHRPGAFVASLMFAYVEPVYQAGVLKGWKVTKSATDWFAFGYDDPGSSNNDHDDFMMVGHLRATPLPGALFLLGSVLGGGLLAGRWRRSRGRRPRLADA